MKFGFIGAGNMAGAIIKGMTIGTKSYKGEDISVTSKTVTSARKLAEEIARADGEGIAMILGPVPAALPRFRGEYRYQLIVKAAEESALRELVLPVAEKLKKDRKSGVKYQLALNPTNIV